jgi:hypothetical protein
MPQHVSLIAVLADSPLAVVLVASALCTVVGTPEDPA